MGILSNFSSDWRKVLVAAALIIVLAAFLRFYHIGFSFSNNGIDEGIMIERTRLVSEGLGIYTDIPCDQAPLAFYLGAFTNGDVISLRELSALLSLVAIVACMEAARRIRGNAAMLLTGLLLAVDFALLRESRLYSIDGMSTYFLAGSLLLFVMYIQNSSKLLLASSGVLMGLSATAKLLGVLGLIGLGLFLLIEAWKIKDARKGRLLDIVLLGVFSAIPMIAFMIALGPSEMIDGMIFSQADREFDPYQKLSILAFFGLNIAYVIPLVYTRALWKLSRETRMLLCVSYVILLFMIFQPLNFFHHLPLMSPSLAVLAGVAFVLAIELEKGHIENIPDHERIKKRYPSSRVFLAVSMVGIIVSAGIAGLGLIAQHGTIQAYYGGIVQMHTEPGEWVISGDPLIAAWADRSVPPDVVNVAYLANPVVTLEDIQAAVEEYDVRVVVVCYMLNDMDGLMDWLESRGFSDLESTPGATIRGQHPDKSVLDFFQEGIGPVHVMIKE